MIATAMKINNLSNFFAILAFTLLLAVAHADDVDNVSLYIYSCNSKNSWLAFIVAIVLTCLYGF